MSSINRWFKAKSVLMLLSVMILVSLPYWPEASLQAITLAKPASSSLIAPPASTCTTGHLSKVEAEVEQEFIQLLLQSSQFEAFRANLEQTHPNVFSFQPEQSYALTDGCQMGVYMPISGGAGYSFYALWFEAVSKVPAQSLFSLFTYNPQGNIVMQAMLQDRQLEAIITPSGQLLGGTVVKDGQKVKLEQNRITTTDFFSCMQDCIQQSGLPEWVFTAITVACDVICWVTPGSPLCWGCLAVAAGIFTVEVLLCWQQCTGVTIHQIYLPVVISSAR